ncbi:MAG: DEAD/DEAH box helicase [Gammaproteobacteria bacterium]
MTFQDLGLSAELLRAVAEQGYDAPTPIQQRGIPLILQGRDVLAAAQTGTGKTAGFTLPILQRLQDAPRSDRRRPRVLVLCPTRELALQVEASVETYGRHLPFRSTVIFGGVGINPQIERLRRGVDIVVATPGRLLDHMGRGTVDLGGIEVLVLDEADRMLDMGFIHDIRKVLKALPPRRQNLLFSATFSTDIRRLAAELLDRPTEIEVAPRNSTAERVSQVVHPLDKARKREFLSHRIGSQNWRQVLVFTRTKHGANRLAKQLNADGLTADAIHGNKTQGARVRAHEGFKNGDVRVLVATDIAARGLDIDRLPHVVNYDLPNVPEDYVHRIGRTARAGQDGHAVSLVTAEEGKQLADIERLLKTRIPREVVPGYEPGPQATALARPDAPRMRNISQSRDRKASPGGGRPAASGTGERRAVKGRRRRGGRGRGKTRAA